MFSTAGQPNWNFFKNNFSNLISVPDLTNNTGGKLLSGKFSGASPYIGNVGLADLALYDQDGIQAAPVFPFQLIFKPNPANQMKFTDDFQASYMDQLAGLDIGLVYDVYAIDKPGCKEQKIGSISSTVKFTASNFSDTKLFFRHNLAETDNASHPDWANYKDDVSFGIFSGFSIKKAQNLPNAAAGCPFAKYF